MACGGSGLPGVWRQFKVVSPLWKRGTGETPVPHCSTRRHSSSTAFRGGSGGVAFPPARALPNVFALLGRSRGELGAGLCPVQSAQRIEPFRDRSGDEKIVSLFHPRNQDWNDHFSVHEGFVLGMTPEGRATVNVCDTNSRQRLEWRRWLADLGARLHTGSGANGQAASQRNLPRFGGCLKATAGTVGPFRYGVDTPNQFDAE